MKKTIKIIILGILILNIFLQTGCCAAVEVNKENLKESLEKLKEYSNVEDKKINFNVNDNEIEIIMNDSISTKMKYDLSNKPTFSIETVITKDMDYEAYCEEDSNSQLIAYGFLAVAGIANIEAEDSHAYYIKKLTEDILKNTSNSEVIDINNFDAIEYAKKIYNEEITYNYEFFKVVMGKANETSDTYTIKYTLIVDDSADFSKLKGYAENNDFKSESTSTTNQNAIVNDMNEVKDNNSQANLSEIPKAGKQFGIDNILEIIIICAVLLLAVCLLKDKRK